MVFDFICNLNKGITHLDGNNGRVGNKLFKCNYLYMKI